METSQQHPVSETNPVHPQLASSEEGHPAGIEKFLEDGNFHFCTAHYELALKYAREALRMACSQGDRSLILKAADLLTAVYGHLGSIPEDIAFGSVLFGMLERSTSNPEFARACAVIGDLYGLLGDQQQAIIYLLKALERFQYLEDHPGQVRCHQHLAERYLETGELDQAYEHAQKALAFCQNNGSLHARPACLNILGAVLLARGRPGNANRRFQQALQLTQLEKQPFEMIRSQILIGDLMLRQSQFTQAVEYLKRALTSAENHNTKKLCGLCHQRLSAAYKHTGQFALALQHLESFQSLQKASSRNNLINQLRGMETAHKIEAYNQRNEQLRLAIQERTRNQAELEHLATTDPLTGLSNRRHFFTLAEHLTEEAVGSGLELSCIMMDIDHFKSINDRFGHPVGDEVLVMVARQIQESLRTQDILCRYGGEEFCVLLPDTCLKMAYQVAERIRTEIEEQVFKTDQHTIQLTISTGIADLTNSPKRSLMGLLGHADQALYKAKHRGRNRTAVFSKSR